MEPRPSGPSVAASQSAKMPEGTVFSSVEEKDRAHLTRTSDTSCMIEGDSDDERKTVILGRRKTLMSTMPRDVGIVKRLERRILC